MSRLPPGPPKFSGPRKRVRNSVIAAVGALGAEAPARRGLERYRLARSSTRLQASAESRQWRSVKHEVRAATAGSGPIVVGPWLSEVGFEVLYWVPFLRWLADRFEIEPERLHVISRGGVRSWYGDIAGHYIDIFDLMSPDEFRDHTEARWADVGGQKQMELNRWDRDILKLASGRVPHRRPGVLHPSLMYRFFRDYFKGSAPVGHVLKHTDLTPMAVPDGGDWAARLPSEPFVAVKFYFRPSFPDLPLNREAVHRIVEQLSERMPVVLLNTGLQIDDHSDVEPGGSQVVRLLEGVPPSENLHVQSIAISRAQAFVGTYGGLSYLAPFYGTHSVACYSEPQHFLPSHLEFARRMSYRTGGGLTMFSTRQKVVGT